MPCTVKRIDRLNDKDETQTSLVAYLSATPVTEPRVGIVDTTTLGARQQATVFARHGGGRCSLVSLAWALLLKHMHQHLYKFMLFKGLFKC